MQTRKPDEVRGLQDKVRVLKSVRNRYKLTIKDNPQNEYEWTLEECMALSHSFRVFSDVVHPDYYDNLLPLCLDLDQYLNKESDPNDNYLDFNIKKYQKNVFYEKLNDIEFKCLADAEFIWFCSFIAIRSNLANKADTVRKNLAPFRGTGKQKEV